MTQPTGESGRRVSDILSSQYHPAGNVPRSIQKHPEVGISDAEIQTHSTIQATASSLLTASTVPALYWDPGGVGLAAGAGIVAGLATRIFTTSSPQSLLTSAERYATMINSVKVGTVSLQSVLISANTLANVFVPMYVKTLSPYFLQSYLYLQGFFGGMHLGAETGDKFQHYLFEMISTPNKPDTSFPPLFDSTAIDDPDNNPQTTVELGDLVVKDEI